MDSHSPGELMVEANSDWTLRRFDQIASNITNRVDDPSEAGVDYYVGLEHLDTDSLRIRRWGSPEDVSATKLLFEPGDVVFGRRRAYQRKLGVAEFWGIASAHSLVLRANSDVVLPEFLPFFIQSDMFMERAQQISVGSLSPTVNWKTLARQTFSLPSVEMQRDLMPTLEASLDLCQTLADAVDAAERLVESFCREVANGQGERVPIGNVAKFSSGKSKKVSTLSPTPTADTPIPVYGGNGISGFTNESLPGLSPPTVVLGRVGQYCGVTHLVLRDAWITDNALYPKTLGPEVRPEYLAVCLRGAQLNRNKLGEYLPLITQKVVHAATLPLISKERQLEVAAAFDTIVRAAARITGRLEAAKALHHSLLRRVLMQEQQ